MNPLLSNQNNPAMIRLLKASIVAYKKSKYWEVKITYFIIVLALAYPYVYLNNDDKVKQILLGCSFFLTILIQLFYNISKNNTTKGAIIKEEFDVRLFGLPWKSTLKKPDHIEVSDLSTQYKGKEISNWYSSVLGEHIPKNVAIAVCQHENTGWDIILRNKYRAYLWAVFICYSIGLSILIFVEKIHGLTIFSVCFSILSFYTHLLSLIRGHSSAIEKREAIGKRLDDLIMNKKDITIAELRDIQDDIFITRQESAKVPDFFSKLNNKKIDQKFKDYVITVNDVYML